MNDELTTISLLGKEAAHELAELEALCFSTPWNAEQYAKLLEQTDRLRQNDARPEYVPPYAVFGIRDKSGTLCAYISLTVNAAAQEAEVFNIAVRPALRGKGLGKRLLSSVLLKLQHLGITTIFLEVRVSNTPAIRLYTGQGFQKAGLRKNYYSDTGEDALVLRADIAS